MAEDLRDEVDEIVASWQRERPDLDLAPMQVLSRINRLARHLDRQRSAAFAAHGLETWEFDVLSTLRRSGAPYQLSPGQLIRATMVTSGTMTNRVDRLLIRGLVERDSFPGDRRMVLVRLTDSGRRAVDGALTALLAAEHEMLAGLGGDDLTAVAAALRQLLAPFSPADS